MLDLAETRRIIGVVLPVHFAPSVSENRIRDILTPVLSENLLYCREDRLVVVVDRGTPAETVLQSFGNLNVHRLEQNRAKAGAVAAGLRLLLESTDAECLVTRDCDGDHFPDDLPRLTGRLIETQRATGDDEAFSMGGRASLELPMGWLREEWEQLTNLILLDMIGYGLARQGRVLDRRFWGCGFLDIQSGYRAYSRKAAERTVQCLDALPDNRSVSTFACELVPFAEILLAGGACGQIQRQTLVEQPVTSYGGVDLADTYGSVLAYLADRHGVCGEVLRAIVESRVCSSSLLFSDHRDQLHRFMRLTGVEPGRLKMARVV